MHLLQYIPNNGGITTTHIRYFDHATCRPGALRVYMQSKMGVLKLSRENGPSAYNIGFSMRLFFLDPRIDIDVPWLVVWNIFYFPIYWVSSHPN